MGGYRRRSSPKKLNEAGQVIGTSSRYNGGNASLGASAWYFDGTVTTEIGLTGSEYFRSDGYENSSVYLLNEAGQAGGSSDRFNGGSNQLGQDAWVYDPILEQTFSLKFSTRSDGYAFSDVEYLGDDGLVIGRYTLYDALDNDLGDRTFWFKFGEGLHDLGSLIEEAVPAINWDWSANAIRGNGRGQILGHGKLTGQTDGLMAFLLTPVVPEPSSLVLVGLVPSLVGWRRR